jgi:hypothetical protein
LKIKGIWGPIQAGWGKIAGVLRQKVDVGCATLDGHVEPAHAAVEREARWIGQVHLNRRTGEKRMKTRTVEQRAKATARSASDNTN